MVKTNLIYTKCTRFNHNVQDEHFIDSTVLMFITLNLPMLWDKIIIYAVVLDLEKNAMNDKNVHHDDGVIYKCVPAYSAVKQKGLYNVFGLVNSFNHAHSS